MFTGIVEELGEVRSFEGDRLVVGCRTVTAGSDVGTSIAVNGVCLTVVDRSEGHLGFDVSAETRGRTSLARLRPGSGVNLERSVTLTTRLGGHLVQGHVDGVGEIVATRAEGEGTRIWVRVPAGLERYVAEKGSVAVDGVSLTVAGLDGDAFTVAVVPHTMAVTTFGRISVGDPVNVEVDVLAKYVERIMGVGA